MRTAVETTNVASHADIKDKTRAECFRTFSTVSFPVAELLSREDKENHTETGFPIIKAIRFRNKKQSFADTPVDLLYGFRGKSHAVSMLSAYEMLRDWGVEEINIPTTTHKHSNWTEAGSKYIERCKLKNKTPRYIPGEHYRAVEKQKRVLVPDHMGLSNLRHK